MNKGSDIPIPSSVVITGAARGIGRAIAEKLLHAGVPVIGTYCDGAEEAISLSERYGTELVRMYRVDLKDREQTRAFADALRDDPVGGLVLNAGIIDFASLEDADDANWDAVLEVNLTSAWVLVRGLLECFVPGAAVVAISSTDAFTASYSSVSYTVSKAGLNALMNCFAAVLGPRGVRAIPLCAGWVDSGMSTPESLDAAALTPLGRNGRPSDIANVVAFLLSEEAAFVTGSPLVVDGGYGLVDYIIQKEAEGLATS